MFDSSRCAFELDTCFSLKKQNLFLYLSRFVFLKCLHVLYCLNMNFLNYRILEENRKLVENISIFFVYQIEIPTIFEKNLIFFLSSLLKINGFALLLSQKNLNRIFTCQQVFLTNFEIIFSFLVISMTSISFCDKILSVLLTWTL
jgi:hypothetical protein